MWEVKGHEGVRVRVGGVIDAGCAGSSSADVE